VPEEYLRVGQIVRPHGVWGGVKLEPLTDDTARFAALKEAYLEGDGYRKIAVSATGIAPNEVILMIEGVDTRDAAEKLRGAYLCVDRAHAVTPPEGRYFISDLIGCEVTDTNGKSYGELAEIYFAPASDVYVIRRKGEKGVLTVPALKKLLAEVDVAAKRIVLDAAVLEEVGLFEN
jgi:16S rRNA processing protein RimM